MAWHFRSILKEIHIHIIRIVDEIFNGFVDIESVEYNLKEHLSDRYAEFVVIVQMVVDIKCSHALCEFGHGVFDCCFGLPGSKPKTKGEVAAVPGCSGGHQVTHAGSAEEGFWGSAHGFSEINHFNKPPVD